MTDPVASRIAKGIKCPLMSRPVIHRVDHRKNPGVDINEHKLFKAPCMGPECAFAHVQKREVGEDNRIISVLYCKSLSQHDEYIEIGEIDETTQKP